LYHDAMIARTMRIRLDHALAADSSISGRRATRRRAHVARAASALLLGSSIAAASAIASSGWSFSRARMQRGSRHTDPRPR
jgi:hypothetical protein